MSNAVNFVNSLVAKKTTEANLDAVLDALWQRFGGAEGIAAAAKEQFDIAKDGSAAKLNMLKMMVEQVGELASRKSKAATSELEAEDMEDVVALVQQAQKVISDSRSLPPEDPSPADA